MWRRTQHVKLWTDGACWPNPGPGGWAALLDFRGQRKQVFGYTQDTTNNRMELQAVIQGLMALKRRCKVTVYSDSRYVINGARGAQRTVANGDLWDELRRLMAEHVHVGFVWIKGHNGTSDNELVNRLAQQQARGFWDIAWDKRVSDKSGYNQNSGVDYARNYANKRDTRS